MPKTNVSHSYQATSLEEQQAAYDRWAKEYEFLSLIHISEPTRPY